MKTWLLVLVLVLPFWAHGQSFYERYLSGSQSLEGRDLAEMQDGSILSVVSGLRYSLLVKLDAQGDLLWEKRYDSVILSKIIILPNNDVMMLGEKKGAVLMRTDSLGNIQWAKHFARSTATVPHELLLCSNGDLLVSATDSARAIIIRLDDAGLVKWSKHYYGLDLRYGLMTNIVEDTDGSLTFAALVSEMIWPSPQPANKTALIKTDSVGNVLWSTSLSHLPDPLVTLPMDFFIHPVQVFRASNGDIFLNYFWGIWFMYGGPTYQVARFNASGTLQWTSQAIDWAPVVIASESPTGTLNFTRLGGTTADVVFPVQAGILQTDLNLTVLKDISYRPYKKNFDHFEFNACKQFADGRFVFTGIHDAQYPTRGAQYLATDDTLGQSCTAVPQPLYPLMEDTFIVGASTTITIASGITESNITINDSTFALTRCDCASLPWPNFGLNVQGNTVTVTDSSLNADHYVWRFSDNTIDTTQNPVHTFTDSVWGYVSVEIRNGCGSNGTFKAVFDTVIIPPVGVVEPMLPTLMLYPNPAQNLVNIHTNGQDIGTAHLLNSLGQVVLQSKGSLLEIGSLAPGLYWVIAEVDGKLLRQKLVKEL